MFHRYILTTSGINGLFGIYNTYNAHVIRDNKVINKMLIGEKIQIIIGHIITGWITVPFNICNFINYLEIKYRNDTCLNYGLDDIFEKKPKKIFDYYP
jgi:hypothetical protein